MVARDDAMILVTLSSSDRLYLTQAEADRLADQLRQELVCRTTAQVDEPVVVADIPLSPAEAWQLVDNLEDSLTEAEVDWQTEGF
jgi:hypothetical protein